MTISTNPLNALAAFAAQVRINDTPELEIAFVDRPYAPVGLGEPATTVVGPAIGNAIFNAVGARLRHLPITPAAVKAALAKA